MLVFAKYKTKKEQDEPFQSRKRLRDEAPAKGQGLSLGVHALPLMSFPAAAPQQPDFTLRHTMRPLPRALIAS